MASESTSNRHTSSDADHAVVRRLFERVYSKGDLRLVDELVASDCTGYSAESADAYLGPQGMKTHVIRLRTAFRGFTIEIDALHVAGEAVEVQWTARGTHERPFLDVEPTCNVGPAGEEPRGNRIAVTGSASGTLTDEGIREWVMRWNLDSLRHQLDGSDGQSKGDERETESLLPT